MEIIKIPIYVGRDIGRIRLASGGTYEVRYFVGRGPSLTLWTHPYRYSVVLIDVQVLQNTIHLFR